MFSLVSRKFLAMRNITLYSVSPVFTTQIFIFCRNYCKAKSYQVATFYNYQCHIYMLEVKKYCSCLFWLINLAFVNISWKRKSMKIVIYFGKDFNPWYRTGPHSCMKVIFFSSPAHCNLNSNVVHNKESNKNFLVKKKLSTYWY